MNAIERKIAELFSFMPPLTKRDDFDSFWNNNLNKFKSKPLNSMREKTVTPMTGIDAYNVSFEIPVLVSAAMKDPICPAETIFAAYNRITAEKDIKIYPFSDHATPLHFNREMLNFISRKFNIL